jgi:hypothetical protein
MWTRSSNMFHQPLRGASMSRQTSSGVDEIDGWVTVSWTHHSTKSFDDWYIPRVLWIAPAHTHTYNSGRWYSSIDPSTSLQEDIKKLQAEVEDGMVWQCRVSSDVSPTNSWYVTCHVLFDSFWNSSILWSSRFEPCWATTAWFFLTLQSGLDLRSRIH